MGVPITVWSRQQIGARVLAGEILIIFKDQLLLIPDQWLHTHPGGSLALMHFVGRDASDEIEANHSDTTFRLVQRYSIGQVELNDGVWLPFTPPIATGWVRRPGLEGKMQWFQDAAVLHTTEDSPKSKFFPPSSILLTENHSAQSQCSGPTLSSLELPPSPLSLAIQSRHSKAWRQLHQRIIVAGLYETHYLAGYGPEIARYTVLGGLSVYAYAHGWFLTSATFLGLFWHQLVFAAHDLGHMGVTHDWTVDRILATLVANFIGGMSIGWWVQNHNVHHLVTNHPSHDPDIQYVPFFAITPVFLKSLYSSYYKRTFKLDRVAKILLSIQHKLFYIVMAFGRFNLYRLSYTSLYKMAFDSRRAKGGNWAWRLEVMGVIFFWVWYGSALYGCGTWQKALAYLVISHVVTSPLHVQLVLSHFSMPTGDLGSIESFPHRQLRTTTDVICPESIDFLHGGLHLQVTHHLFPRLPRHNLRRASKLVKQFAKEEGLEYAEYGFLHGNKEVIGVLRHVAEQVKIMGKVAESEASLKRGI
ncbi:delta 8-sphingoloid desaturase protein [Panaeolus papilionaceus]|nr:delta 8-sphingoloid desaturase protein [Panaeolus papilionaceus]